MNKIPDVTDVMKCCMICPRECGVDRTAGEKGICKAGSRAEVYSARLHFGEEPPISAANGSGTIFFNHCNLRCAYCQNFRFSQLEDGKGFDVDELADLMLLLEGKGAHNINFVTPTHYSVHIANAVIAARKRGLKVPVVYNSSGYEKTETLRMLEGLIDVYLVDMRYGDDLPAAKYSSCGNYVEVNKEAVGEMHRQVGDLRISNSGAAERGVIIRHLILPDNICNTEVVFKFISDCLGSGTYISLMSQYFPAFRAGDYAEISRGINKREHDHALALIEKYGLKNGWIQEYADGRVDSDFAGTNIDPNV